MTLTVDNKPIVIPDAVRRKAGLRRGDRVEFKISRREITIVWKSPSADDEYTPLQRRAIDLRLKKALAEVKEGRTAAPFNTAGEMIASIKRGLAKSGAKKSKSRSR